MARKTWGSTRLLRSGRIQARYTGPDGKIHKAPDTFPDELSAMGWLSSVRNQIDLGTWSAPEEKKPAQKIPTVAEMVYHWLDQCRSSGLRPTSLATYTAIVQHRILCYPQLANTAVDKLTTALVATWWVLVVKDHPDTPDRNKRAYGKLKAALGLAVEYGYIGVNPVQVSAARRTPRRKNKTLPTTSQLMAIMSHTPERYQFAVCMCLFHGLRVGECLGLQTEHVVHLPGGGIGLRVEGTLQRLKGTDGRMFMRWQPMPKTQAGVRTVPVLSEFTELVTRHIAGVPSGYLTTTQAGNIVMDTSFRSIFNRAKQSAGAPMEITPHYGRNWLITRLAEAGATPKEIGRVLGQEDVSTIVGVYMKVRESRPAELMSRITTTDTTTQKAV